MSPTGSTWAEPGTFETELAVIAYAATHLHRRIAAHRAIEATQRITSSTVPLSDTRQPFRTRLAVATRELLDLLAAPEQGEPASSDGEVESRLGQAVKGDDRCQR